MEAVPQLAADLDRAGQYRICHHVVHRRTAAPSRDLRCRGDRPDRPPHAGLGPVRRFPCIDDLLDPRFRGGPVQPRAGFADPLDQVLPRDQSGQFGRISCRCRIAGDHRRSRHVAHAPAESLQRHSPGPARDPRNDDAREDRWPDGQGHARPLQARCGRRHALRIRPGASRLCRYPGGRRTEAQFDPDHGRIPGYAGRQCRDGAHAFRALQHASNR